MRGTGILYPTGLRKKLVLLTNIQKRLVKRQKIKLHLYNRVTFEKFQQTGTFFSLLRKLNTEIFLHAFKNIFTVFF